MRRTDLRRLLPGLPQLQAVAALLAAVAATGPGRPDLLAWERPWRRRYQRPTAKHPSRVALPAYAAVEIAAAANADAQAYGGKLADIIARSDFATALGKVKFDDKGDLSESPYRLYRFDGTKFVEAEEQR